MIEHNIIRHFKTIGLDIGDEGGIDPEVTNRYRHILAITQFSTTWFPLMVVRVSLAPSARWGRSRSIGADQHDQPCPACEVHRNFGGSISFNVIAGNTFLGCNADENAALKVHSFSGVVQGNLLIDKPYSAGIWFDDLWWNLRVTRNIVIATANSSWAGIMLEVSTGPALVDNNVIATAGGSNGGAAGGIFESDSNNVTIVQNLILDTGSTDAAAINFGGTGNRDYNIGVWEPNILSAGSPTAVVYRLLTPRRTKTAGLKAISWLASGYPSCMRHQW